MILKEQQDKNCILKICVVLNIDEYSLSHVTHMKKEITFDLDLSPRKRRIFYSAIGTDV